MHVSSCRKKAVTATIVAGMSLVISSFSFAAPTAHAAEEERPIGDIYIRPETPPSAADLSADDISQLELYLRDTYTSLDAMTDPVTGLPADNITGDLDFENASRYTSPTNIGGYLWSTVIARDAGIITAEEAHNRLTTTLASLSSLQRHETSGMFYNWYDPRTGQRVEIWPDDGNEVYQFLSSVDNGWLAAGLMIAANADPDVAAEALDIYNSMNFGMYFNPEAAGGLGLIRGGFWDEYEAPGSVAGNYLGHGPDVFYTGHHYDTTVSETRIALYIGIANGQIPPTAYYGTYRAFPSNCDWSWQQQRPVGITRSYNGIDVYEGAYPYRGMSIVPGWGGSMFEALMPNMLVPEEEWGPNSWGLNHPLVVRAQKEHGLDEAGYGYWGFSPASNPHGGYLEYGVDQLGLGSDGYFSDGVTNVDTGFYGCRDGENPSPEYGDGVVTPHAAFLGISYDPLGVLTNVANLRSDFDMYGEGGFYDSVAVRSGTVAKRYLSLDQSMVMAAIGNFLYDGHLRDYFVTSQMEDALRPVMEAEIFSASAGPIIPRLTSHNDGQVLNDTDALFRGTGEPGSLVRVQSDSTSICESSADAQGAWTCGGALQEGRHEVEIVTRNDAGIQNTSQVYELIVATNSSPGTPPTEGKEPSEADNSSHGGTASVAESQKKNGSPLAKTGASMVTLVSAFALLLACGGTVLIVLRRYRD